MTGILSKSGTSNPGHLFLVGLMGTGKSSVGKALAARLALPFYDIDAQIEAESKQSIAELFRTLGEGEFRARESKTLAALSQAPRGVVACGGGIVLASENRTLLHTLGTPILLRASLETLAQRLSSETRGRPLLSKPNWQDDLKRLSETREPLYNTIAIQIHTDGKSVDEISDLIVQALKEKCSKQTGAS